MTAEVVGLHGDVAPTEPVVKPDVVEALETLLAQARAGEVIGLHVIALHPGDLTDWVCAGRNTRGMIGAAMLMYYEVCRETLENV